MEKNINNNNEESREITQNSQRLSPGNVNSRKRKKVRIIILTILLVIVFIIGVLCVRFWHIVRMVNPENIGAYMDSVRYSREEIEKQMDDNKIKMEKIAEENPLINIRGELTPDEVEALSSGEITKEEARKIVKGEVTLEEIREQKETPEEPLKEENPQGGQTLTQQSKPTDATGSEKEKPSKDKPQVNTGDSKKDPPKPPATTETPKTPATPEEEAQDRVSELVSELYVVQADFISRLEAIGDQAYADYKATTYDRSKIMSIVDSYTATVGAMEVECDNKVNALISELEAEIAKVDGDKSLPKEIKKYYYKEKKLKKSYYLDKLDDEDYK